MFINSTTLSMLNTAYEASFMKGIGRAKSHAFEVAMKTTSPSSESIYPWLGQFPQMREWIGDRQIRSMQSFGWTIKNRLFESTFGVPRTTIEDDQYGLFGTLFEQMGDTTALEPDRLVFELIRNGFQGACYDGKTFFAGDHLSADENGNEITVSNMQDGGGSPWFLIDTTKAMKPFVWQERLPYEFQKPDIMDSRVILRDEFIYGVRGRANAGYGLWQLAFGSKAALDAEHYQAARITMQQLRGDQGGMLGVTPTLLVVGPSLEAAARRLLKATQIGSTSTVGDTTVGYAETNVWYQSADLLVSPFLD